MRTSIHLLATATLVAGLMVAAYSHDALAKGADPLIGTWKLDPAKSKFSPGPGYKALTVTFEAAGEGIKTTSDGTDPEGKPMHSEYTGNYDGKDYPITGYPMADIVTLKKVDAHTSVRTDKKDGKVVGSFTRKVSADGKTLTVTQTGTDPTGKPIHNTLVLDKQ